MRDGRQRVVILYSHPLLGEGLGRLLAADPDLVVELVHVDDLDQAVQALACSPDVVIVERIPPVHAIDLMRLAPSALLIEMGLDAGSTWTYRRDELASQPEDLLRAIHGREGSHLPSVDDPVGAPALPVAAGVPAAPSVAAAAAASVVPAGPVGPAAMPPSVAPTGPVAAPASTAPTGVAGAATALRGAGA